MMNFIYGSLLLQSCNAMTVQRPESCGMEVEMRTTAPEVAAENVVAAKNDNMRYLALIAHNNMKPTLKTFVQQHAATLKNFRLTGTGTTMKMVKSVFAEQQGSGDDLVYGPECGSGPLGGDAQLAAMLVTGNLGGVIFFPDPLTPQPHQADVDSLFRLLNVHNLLYASNVASANSMMVTLGMAVHHQDPNLIPSFFTSLESPCVRAYKEQQNKVAASVDLLSPGTQVKLFPDNTAYYLDAEVSGCEHSKAIKNLSKQLSQKMCNDTHLMLSGKILNVIKEDSDTDNTSLSSGASTANSDADEYEWFKKDTDDFSTENPIFDLNKKHPMPTHSHAGRVGHRHKSKGIFACFGR